MAGRYVPRRDRTAEVDRLWRESPEIERALAAAETIEDARLELLMSLDDAAEAISSGELDLGRSDWALALDAIDVVRRMILPENEAAAGFSTLEHLWRLARGADDEVSPAFIDEWIHLFREIHGRAEFGKGWLREMPHYASLEARGLPQTGRRAGIQRSEALDDLASEMKAGIARFPSGLTQDEVRRRARNRDRILAEFGGTRRDWLEPQWQYAHVLRGEAGVDLLQRLVPLRAEDRAALRLTARHRIPWGITPYYLSLFDFERSDRRHDGQVRAQVIPGLHAVRVQVEHRADRGTALDFMRETDTSPVERVTRRYPSVAILKVCNTCPQVCTYCQRDWQLSDAMALDRLPTRDALESALRWFERHEAMLDVLITGGDPLILGDSLLAYVLDRLRAMDHVGHIRIGSRFPVTMPMRITEALARILGGAVEPGRRIVSLTTHVESAAEITPELVAAVDRLRRHRIQVYNQQVFTLETSRRFQGVATRIALNRAGIDPYYTFYAKGKDEHRDMLVPLARLLQERKEEARLLPGVFRTDEPVFNVPGLGKNHLRARQDREWIGIDADGRRTYLFHPWEKGIAPVAPWTYRDVPIRDYLERLADLGEDPADYESIWSYF